MSNWTEKKIDHASISSPAEVAQVGSGFSRQLSGSQFALAGQDCYNSPILRYWFREAAQRHSMIALAIQGAALKADQSG